jgi:hypothetical protein
VEVWSNILYNLKNITIGIHEPLWAEIAAIHPCRTCTLLAAGTSFYNELDNETYKLKHNIVRFTVFTEMS